MSGLLGAASCLPGTACPQVRRDLELRPEIVNLQDEQYIRKAAERMQDVVRPALCHPVHACCCLWHVQLFKSGSDASSTVPVTACLPTLLPQGQKFEYLLNTGNLVSRSGLDLSQSTGFTVVAEKLNFFRSGLSSAAAAVVTNGGAFHHSSFGCMFVLMHLNAFCLHWAGCDERRLTAAQLKRFPRAAFGRAAGQTQLQLILLSLALPLHSFVPLSHSFQPITATQTIGTAAAAAAGI